MQVYPILSFDDRGDANEYRKNTLHQKEQSEYVPVFFEINPIIFF